MTPLGIGDEVGRQAWFRRPARHFPCAEILHNRHLQPAFGGLQAGSVGGRHLLRGSRRELPIERFSAIGSACFASVVSGWWRLWRAPMPFSRLGRFTRSLRAGRPGARSSRASVSPTGGRSVAGDRACRAASTPGHRQRSAPAPDRARPAGKPPLAHQSRCVSRRIFRACFAIFIFFVQSDVHSASPLETGISETGSSSFLTKARGRRAFARMRLLQRNNRAGLC